MLALTVLLSLYLAGTIARPIAPGSRRRPTGARAAMAKRARFPISRAGATRSASSSALAARDDHALWQRMDAIERFAADVAHEIKNPLTSLRSAVETCAPDVKDPAQQAS